MLRELKAYKRKHGIHHPLLAVDCENDPATGDFICAGVFGDIKLRTTKRVKGKHVKVTTTKRVKEYFTIQDELCEYLMSLKRNACLLVFFNLSYDKVFIDSVVDHATVLQCGTRLILLKLKNGIKAIDLTNHTPSSTEKHGGKLADWIKYLDMTEKHGIAKAELTDYYDRVMNDAAATYYLGQFLEDFYYNECGIPLQVTVGACAMKLFTMKFFTHYWSRTDDFLSLYERRSYYGGRVELFKRGKQKTYAYDINSQYLSIMRDCLIPDIQSGKYVCKKITNWRRYLNDYLGVWNVRVKTPDVLYIPVLPVRLDGKLKFPTGTFDGVWTSVELLKALEVGYEILDVYDFLYYSRCQYYFKEYALFVWGKRKEYKAVNNLPMDLMIKKLGNALYGKFAQRNSADYFGRVGDYEGTLPDGIQFFNHGSETWVLVKGEATPAKFEFPVVSSFITSYARLKLYDAMIANQESLIYVDTDCLKLTRPAVGIKIGGDLGEWSLETEGEPVIYRRPKLYGTKKKGVPDRAILVSRNKVKEVWKFERPMREREAIKRGLKPNVWVEVTKHLIFNDDKRLWIKNRSMPLSLLNDQKYWTETLDYNDPKYLKWLERRYADRYSYGFKDHEVDYPEYADQEKDEKLTARREGNMIFQR